MSRSLREGVGGPVGSGKTALIEQLVPLLVGSGRSVVVVTNDILTREDEMHVKRTLRGVLEEERVLGVETGSCPHTAVREDPSMNLAALAELDSRFPETDVACGGGSMRGEQGRQVRSRQAMTQVRRQHRLDVRSAGYLALGDQRLQPVGLGEGAAGKRAVAQLEGSQECCGPDLRPGSRAASWAASRPGALWPARHPRAPRRSRGRR